MDLVAVATQHALVPSDGKQEEEFLADQDSFAARRRGKNSRRRRTGNGAEGEAGGDEDRVIGNGGSARDDDDMSSLSLLQFWRYRLLLEVVLAARRMDDEREQGGGPWSRDEDAEDLQDGEGARRFSEQRDKGIGPRLTEVRAPRESPVLSPLSVPRSVVVVAAVRGNYPTSVWFSLRVWARWLRYARSTRLRLGARRRPCLPSKACLESGNRRVAVCGASV